MKQSFYGFYGGDILTPFIFSTPRIKSLRFSCKAIIFFMKNLPKYWRILKP